MDNKLQKLQEFLEYRGYEGKRFGGMHAYKYKRFIDSKFLIEITHFLNEDKFKISVNTDLIDNAQLCIDTYVGGTENFMEQFSQLEKNIIFSVNRFPYEVQQPDSNEHKPFQSIDG